MTVRARRGSSIAGGAHLPALDGLRGLAIVMVLFVHFIGDLAPRTPVERGMVKLANYGIWGVDLFFVLSGFLITGILHDAKASPHYLRNFYVRRTLRIFPLYFGVLLLLFGVLPFLPISYPAGLSEAARHQGWLWTYTCNVYLARAGSWALPYVSHFWSLAVEEHFYLLWPWVVLALRREALLGACAVGVVFALGLRVALSFAGAGEVALVVLTPCRLDALFIGAFLALAVRSVGIEPVAREARRWLVPLAALVLLVSAWNAATHGAAAAAWRCPCAARSSPSSSARCSSRPSSRRPRAPSVASSIPGPRASSASTAMVSTSSTASSPMPSWSTERCRPSPRPSARILQP